MIAEFFERLSGWSLLDTWIVVAGMLAAMACAVPGVFLVLRRQSLLGDAISHTVLLGIVGAFLSTQALRHAGWTAPGQGVPHLALLLGAAASGILSAVLTEWVQQRGKVESSAALGVVFTSLFAAGLLLIRAFADSVHIDPDCVLYGQIETVWSGEPGIPSAVVVSGVALLGNLVLAAVFFKQLQISTFDPAFAESIGVPVRGVNYAMAAVTAATLTAVFESVGSILVIAMLIVPAATASLLTSTLPAMLLASVALAALAASTGHAMAITVPSLVFPRLGFPSVTDASTAGMMAFSCGLLFVAALFFSPRQGIVSQVLQRLRLTLRITGEDLLGLLYRLEERTRTTNGVPLSQLQQILSPRSSWLTAIAARRQKQRGRLESDAHGWRLTDAGRATARSLVRAHRLWESYVAKHWPLPADHLHDPAERVEHFLDPALQRQLNEELDQPPIDPHGSHIPEADQPS